MNLKPVGQIFFLLFLEAFSQSCNQPESPQEIKAKEKCKKELGPSPSWECAHICLLKNMGVIVNKNLVKAEWKNFVDKKFVESVREKLLHDLALCSKYYTSYQQNKRCDENNEFYRCYIDAIDSVCY